MKLNPLNCSIYKSICLVLLLSLLTIILPLTDGITVENLVSPSSTKFYVGGSGHGNYTMIQHAIDNASDGDTVFVYRGLYYENLIVDKSITLEGEHRDLTIIDGGNAGDIPCIDIIANNVLVRGFMIQWADWEYHEPGIKITTEDVRIMDNNISIHDKGINLISGAKNCIIEHNIISNNHEGIYIWPTAAGGHIIRYNDIRNNNYGLKIYHSNDLFIENNTIVENDWYGILMQNTKDSTIVRNTFEHNSQGVSVDEGSHNNLFFHNNFISNRRQAIDMGYNKWNMEYPCGGNHWSDYISLDSDGDGIGDNPYNVQGRSENLDYYPFMINNTWRKNPLKAFFFTPSYGFIHTELQFNVSIEGGIDPYQFQWHFGDGTLSNLKDSTHTYTKPGDYTIIVIITDGFLNEIQESFNIMIYQEDVHPPFISIVNPETGIYINNKKVYSFPLPFSFLIGEFPIVIEVNDFETFIREIHIIIDGELIEIIQTENISFNWPYNKTGFHELEVKAIDLANNCATDKLFIINL
ncbi:MAG: NosD domain-containing protein [Candidatus Thermoplasmatota archaeon]|nr:NosD domain-containing protein [Candidatus Thermoplasmatota archaeon]